MGNAHTTSTLEELTAQDVDELTSDNGASWMPTPHHPTEAGSSAGCDQLRSEDVLFDRRRSDSKLANKAKLMLWSLAHRNLISSNNPNKRLDAICGRSPNLVKMDIVVNQKLHRRYQQLHRDFVSYSRKKRPSPEFSIQEVLTFHGTGKEAAKAIAKEGFRAGYGGIIYSSEDPRLALHHHINRTLPVPPSASLSVREAEMLKDPSRVFFLVLSKVLLAPQTKQEREVTRNPWTGQIVVNRSTSMVKVMDSRFILPLAIVYFTL